MKNEVQVGLDLFRYKVEIDRTLKVLTANRLHDRPAYYVEISGFGKKVDIVIAEDFFADLSATLDYKIAVDAYTRHLRNRMQNFSPYDFLCRTGAPVHIILNWPFYPHTDRDASFINARVQWLPRPSCEGICTVTITHQANEWLAKKIPFVREKLVVNKVRDALDAEELRLYDRDPHAEPAAELTITAAGEKTKVRASTEELEQFILAKVLWLGFQRGDQNTRTWIADPWDAEYLAVDPRDLIRFAQILNAREEIVLNGEFAWAGKALLARGAPPKLASKDRVGLQSTNPGEARMEWDVFICHAREDKDKFVRPLAEALRQYGLKVWYDEFTLKIGDHLRRSIDRGLAHSQYGIVVLSPDFFAKEWPQIELDGLVALEMNGRKLILPVWHNVTVQDVRRYSPTLADRVAANSTEGIDTVLGKLLDAMGSAKSKVGLGSRNIQASHDVKIYEGASADALQERDGAEGRESELDRMSTLMSEMRADLSAPGAEFVREFFVLPNRRVILGGSSKPRFIYYEEGHQNLRGMLDVLEERGYVVNVTPLGNNALIYRMTEELLKYLRGG